MGIGSGIFVFLRRAYYKGKKRIGRPGSREKEIEFEREIPEFPKTRRASAAFW